MRMLYNWNVRKQFWKVQRRNYHKLSKAEWLWLRFGFSDMIHLTIWFFVNVYTERWIRLLPTTIQNYLSSNLTNFIHVSSSPLPYQIFNTKPRIVIIIHACGIYPPQNAHTIYRQAIIWECKILSIEITFTFHFIWQRTNVLFFCKWKNNE